VGREARLKRERREARVAEGAKAISGEHPNGKDLPPRGLPGQDQRLLIRNVFVDPNDPRNHGPVGGGAGKYRVLFTLMRPAVRPVPEYNFTFDVNVPGDSHVAVAPPAVKPPADNPGADKIKVYSKTDDGSFVFLGHANDRGFLGRLEVELDAADFRDAENKAYRALAPSLSNWAVHLDIPVRIWRVHVTELNTNNQQISIVNPFDEMPFALAASGSMTVDFRAFAGLYREAANSNSPVYEYLCLFKIAEGIRNRRVRLAKEANARGEKFSRPQERIPKEPAEFEPWLNAIYPLRRKWDEMALESVFVAEARGRKINELLDKELTDLRVDIAHTLSDKSGEVTLSVDEALHLAKVNHWLPLLKCTVRRMLKNEFPNEYLPYLEEDGTVVDHSTK
jgi:hypothetical protein